MNNNAIEQFISAVKEPEYETNTTYSAIVSRVDSEGVVWVNLAGSEKETPTASTAADVNAGDVVTVQWRNNKLYIEGNYSNPSAGITRVVYVERRVRNANNVANDAVNKANAAVTQATKAKSDAQEAVTKANSSVASDTIHYLATSASSGITINTQGWTTEIQTIDSQKRYLWTYHTYTKANGAVVNTQPVITGTYGVDGTSFTILGSYNTLAELEEAHPTGQLGDAYVVAGDLYVWNGSAWEDVGQIQGPKGDTGDTGTSVTTVINYYLATSASSGVTRDTTGWTTAIQTMTAENQYLWNYEVVKGTGNVTLNTTDPIIIGRYGQDGQDGANGISITGVQPQYYLSTSPSSATGGTWGNTLNYEAGKYIWTRDAITYSNGNTGYSTAIYNSALTSACVNASNALQIAEDTNQYFWHTETGTDTGAHITEIPKEDFIDDPANGGGNLLARSNGIAVRDGLAELAVFGADGSQIGQTGKAHIEMDYHSLQMVDGDTSPHVFFHISDLRDENNEYEYTEEFIGTGYTRRFSLLYIAKRDKELSVTVSDGSGGEAYLGSSVASTLWFETAPTDGAKITVSYITSSSFAKAYTLGMRKNNSDIGPLSTCFGLDNVASGSRSFAVGWNTEATGAGSHSEGYETKANGHYSHAQGYKTIANRAYQVAIGQFNEIDNYNISFGTTGKYAFIIGNGKDEDNRSNALTVDWDGNVEAAGEITGATVNVPISISTSTGTLVRAKAYRYGKIVNLQVTVYNTASVNAGSNIFVGQIDTTKLIPAAVASGSSYYGSHSVVGTISATGQIVVRNASPTAFATSSSNPINISFMYMID